MLNQPPGNCRDYVLRTHTASSYGLIAQTRSARFYKISDEIHRVKKLNIVALEIYYPESLSDGSLTAVSIFFIEKQIVRRG